MSHFTHVETSLKEGDTIIEALKDMGFDVRKNTTILGYRGMKEKVDFGVDISSRYGLGFVRTPKGTYAAVGDRFGIRGFNDILREISRRYSEKIIRREVRKKGYNLISRKTNNDNIELVFVRR